MSNYIDLSVHQLVDFILRKGSIDERSFNSSTMEEGSKLHRSHQIKQGREYKSEVDLKTTILLDNFKFFLHGRCDGIFVKEPIAIEEIKTTNCDLELFFQENRDWHLGQAHCYAYMYSKENNLKSIKIILTYISQINHRVLKKEFNYSFYELENFVLGYLSEYLTFSKQLFKNKEERINSVKSLKFPFSIRKGQKKIIDFSKKAIENNDRVFIEASTGIGKTIAITYAALKGALKNDNSKISFLSAKNSGFKSALDTLQILRNSGLKIVSCEITAKEKICLNSGHNCNPDDCKYARDYYSKLNSILIKYFSKEKNFCREKILDIAKKENVCPFELSLDISLFSDFLIMDYNYVFNPISYLKRLFEPIDNETNVCLLVDEAHNLIDRAREMYSTYLDYNTFNNAYNYIKKIKNKKVKECIENLKEDFDLFKKFEADEYLVLEVLDDDFILHLQRYQDVMKNYLTNHPKFNAEKTKDFNIQVYSFLTIFNLLNEKYRILYKKKEDGFEIILKCLDASEFISLITKKAKGSVFFSGTLTPIDYYQTGILGSNNFKNIDIPSPYNKDNFNLLVNNKISVRYKNRVSSLPKVVSFCNEFISKKIGNYIIFVPSFSYLHELENELIKTNNNILSQKEKMTLSEKEQFISEFVQNPKETKIGLCVLGGSFSEGIDLVDDRLIGVIVIGVGLPTICFENNLIKQYYDNLGYVGFNFAYTNPGINKIMQAVGRLIRSENDKGSALLIDDRYLDQVYMGLYKTNWSNYKLVSSLKDLEKELYSFYDQ